MSFQPLKKGDGIAVLTSGGDAPGMNAVVRAVVRIAHSRELKPVGVRWGFQGLIQDTIAPLSVRDVDGWSRRGGTVLGSSRCEAFRTPEGRATAAENLRKRKIRGVVVIGGNGSLTGAHLLARELDHTGRPFRVIGIPASIDNDLGRTTLCIGTDTALNTIVEACDRIADTACAHARTFVVEVMGRDCGYLAITSAIAAEADGVLFREARLSYDELLGSIVDVVKRAYDPDSGKNRVLVLKSEGVQMRVDFLKERLDEALKREGLPVETRVTVLGHVVRGGSPSAFDRLLAGRLGHAAVRAVERGRTDEMTGWHVLMKPNDPTPTVFDLDPFITFWPLDDVLEETARIVDGTAEVSEWRVRILREAEPFLAA